MKIQKEIEMTKRTDFVNVAKKHNLAFSHVQQLIWHLENFRNTVEECNAYDFAKNEATPLQLNNAWRESKGMRKINQLDIEFLGKYQKVFGDDFEGFNFVNCNSTKALKSICKGIYNVQKCTSRKEIYNVILKGHYCEPLS